MFVLQKAPLPPSHCPPDRAHPASQVPITGCSHLEDCPHGLSLCLWGIEFCPPGLLSPAGTGCERLPGCFQWLLNKPQDPQFLLSAGFHPTEFALHGEGEGELGWGIMIADEPRGFNASCFQLQFCPSGTPSPSVSWVKEG